MHSHSLMVNLKQAFCFSNNTRGLSPSSPDSGNTSPGRQWQFEQVHKPTNYQQMSRRSKAVNTTIEHRGLGSGLASHWVIVNETPSAASKKRVSKQRPSSVTNMKSNSNPSTQTHVPVYDAMFEKLVGSQELSRIDKQYKMKQQIRKESPRRILQIAELVF
jgi:hypothetical protein